jgi:hypothetical protein
MKTIKVYKLIITLACFGFILGFAGNITCLWATPDTGEMGMEEESQDVRSHTGRLDYIDEERVVINDFPLVVLENTRYRTIGGDVTTSDHFSEGDAVSFLTDVKETILVELQMKGTASEEQPKASGKIGGDDTLKFKDGAWTN